MKTTPIKNNDSVALVFTVKRREMTATLGDTLFAPLVQLMISANRIMTFFHFLRFNMERVKPLHGPIYTRNQVSLFAWGMLPLREMDSAINCLKAEGVEHHLSSAYGDWKQLQEIHARWEQPDFVRIRNKFASHQDPQVIRNGLRQLDSNLLLMRRGLGTRLGCFHFDIGDHAMMLGLQGNKVLHELEAIFDQFDQHQNSFPGLVANLVCDLLRAQLHPTGEPLYSDQDPQHASDVTQSGNSLRNDRRFEPSLAAVTVAETNHRIGENLLVGLLQLMISANRLLACRHFIEINHEQYDAGTYYTSLRNSWTVLAWGASQVHELTKSIECLKKENVERKISAAMSDWKELEVIADRWKTQKFTRFRNNFGVHQDRKTIKLGLRYANDELRLLATDPDAPSGHFYFEEADHILLRGLQGDTQEEEFAAMFKAMDRDQVRVPQLIFRLALDLASAL